MNLHGTNVSKVLGIGFAVALSLGVVKPASAMPVLDGAGLTHAVPTETTEVRWGRHWGHRHWGWRHRHWGHRHWGWRHRHWRHRHW
jgi:hypothetical protein